MQAGNKHTRVLQSLFQRFLTPTVLFKWRRVAAHPSIGGDTVLSVSISIFGLFNSLSGSLFIQSRTWLVRLPCALQLSSRTMDPFTE